MASVDGVYDCITKTPFGDQPSVLTVVHKGSTFQGTNAGMLGSLDVKDGKVDGARLSWKMEMTMPMAMVLECDAVVEGDRLTGTIQAGTFGAMAITGKKRS